MVTPLGGKDVLAAGTAVTTEEELLSIMSNGGTATLQNDITLDNAVAGSNEQVIPEGKSVTIETNGHTLTVANTFISVKGELTINGAGAIVAGDSFGCDRVIDGQQGSTVTISNVTINANNHATRVAYLAGTKLKADNAVFTGGYNTTGEPCAGVFVTGVSTVEFNDVTVTGNAYAGTLDTTKGYNDAATDIWFGGQVTAVINSGTYGDLFANQNEYSAKTANPGSVTINNGTYNKVWVEYYQGYSANVTVNNGKFENFVVYEKAAPVIKGGTFHNIIVPAGVDFNNFLAQGLQLTKNTDGTYTVQVADDTTVAPTTTQSAAAKFKTTKTKFKKVKNIKTKKIRIRIKKIKNATGYKIKISTTKKFKKKKTKTITLKNKKKVIRYTFKKAKKGKTYYVKARAYKKINGKKVYAKWSKIKKVKIKK